MAILLRRSRLSSNQKRYFWNAQLYLNYLSSICAHVTISLAVFTKLVLTNQNAQRLWTEIFLACLFSSFTQVLGSNLDRFVFGGPVVNSSTFCIWPTRPQTSWNVWQVSVSVQHLVLFHDVSYWNTSNCVFLGSLKQPSVITTIMVVCPGWRKCIKEAHTEIILRAQIFHLKYAVNAISRQEFEWECVLGVHWKLLKRVTLRRLRPQHRLQESYLHIFLGFSFHESLLPASVPYTIYSVLYRA